MNSNLKRRAVGECQTSCQSAYTVPVQWAANRRNGWIIWAGPWSWGRCFACVHKKMDAGDGFMIMYLGKGVYNLDSNTRIMDTISSHGCVPWRGPCSGRTQYIWRDWNKTKKNKAFTDSKNACQTLRKVGQQKYGEIKVALADVNQRHNGSRKAIRWGCLYMLIMIIREGERKRKDGSKKPFFIVLMTSQYQNTSATWRRKYHGRRAHMSQSGKLVTD